MKKRIENTKIILENLQRKKKTKNPLTKKTITIIILITFIAIIILAGVFTYKYFTTRKLQVQLGENIDSVSLSEDKQTAFVKLSQEYANATNITIIFKDSAGNEYHYSITRTQDTGFPYQETIEINLNDIQGLGSFEPIIEINAILGYTTGVSGTDSDPGTTSTGTTTPSSGSGPSSSSGDPGTTTTCTPDCTGKVCGPDTVCGTSCGPCNSNEECINEICVENIFLDENNNFKTEDITFIMESPNGGYNLTVRSVRPNLSEYPNKRFPVVLKLQGGWGLMNWFLNEPKIQPTASDGMIFVSFNSQLREDYFYPFGDSDRDYSGFKDQVDVAAVLENITQNSNVNPNAIGIWSSSAGAIMAAGILGRQEYKELSEKVRFWIDWEGPSCVRDIMIDKNVDFSTVDPAVPGPWSEWRTVVDAKVGSGLQYTTEDEFWYERCGNNFIENYTGIYQRLQGRNDHALKYYYNHTLDHLNNATNGKASWTRLNNYSKDVIYTEQEIINILDIEELVINADFVWEMLYNISDAEYTPTPIILPEDSPFGIFGAFSRYVPFIWDMDFNYGEYCTWAGDHMQTLGAKYSRQTTQLIWDLKEPILGGGYEWDSSGSCSDIPQCMTDEILSCAYQNAGDDFDMVMVINPTRNYGGGDNVNIAGNEIAFQDFVSAAVERYDGDGIGDYDSNIKVKYWQAYNELGSFWINKGGDIDNYIYFLKNMSEAVKQADPEAKVVLGAVITKGQPLSPGIKSIIQGIGEENVFDVVDLHYWNSSDDWKLSSTQEMRSLLDSEGYTDVEIWSTEHGTYVNEPSKPPITLPLQTESDQALSLIKRYVYNLANGVDKIFWNNLVEWSCFGTPPICGGLFDNMGLISDGKNSGETLATLGVERLSYYTYQLMADKLEGSDWDNIENITEGPDIYVYKFTNIQTAETTWVAWNEGIEQTIQLEIGSTINSVKITGAIPNITTGLEINNSRIQYSNLFNITTQSVVNNNISLTLKDIPVFVEEEIVVATINPLARFWNWLKNLFGI